MILINDDCGDDNLDDMVFDEFDVGNNEEDQDNDLIAASPCSFCGLNQLLAWCQSEYVGNRFDLGIHIFKSVFSMTKHASRNILV